MNVQSIHTTVYKRLLFFLLFLVVSLEFSIVKKKRKPDFVRCNECVSNQISIVNFRDHNRRPKKIFTKKFRCRKIPKSIYRIMCNWYTENLESLDKQ